MQAVSLFGSLTRAHGEPSREPQKKAAKPRKPSPLLRCLNRTHRSASIHHNVMWDSISLKLTRNHHPLHFARAFVDLRDAGVAIMTLDRIVFQITVAAMN